MKRGLILLFMLFLILVTTLPGQAAAWSFGNEQQIIEKGQVVTGDLIFQGESLEVLGVVKGDLLVWGKKVIIKGRIEGDLIGVVTDTLSIEGKIGQNLRVIANQIFFEGVVVGNLTGVASSLNARSESHVQGGILGSFQELTLLGKVDQLVEFTSLTQAKIGGEIEGDLKVKGVPVVWQAPAEFGGKIHDYTGVTRNPGKIKGITLAGKYVVHDQVFPEELLLPRIPILLIIAWFVGSVLLALIFYRLFPRTAWEMTTPSAANFRKNMIVGSISFFLIPLSLGILIVALGVFGSAVAVVLPLIFFLGMSYLFLTLFLNLPVYLWLGRVVLKSRFHPIILILAGAFLMVLSTLIPFVNFIAQLIFVAQGFGMILGRIKFQSPEENQMRFKI